MLFRESHINVSLCPQNIIRFLSNYLYICLVSAQRINKACPRQRQHTKPNSKTNNCSGSFTACATCFAVLSKANSSSAPPPSYRLHSTRCCHKSVCSIQSNYTTRISHARFAMYTYICYVYYLLSCMAFFLSTSCSASQADTHCVPRKPRFCLLHRNKVSFVFVHAYDNHGATRSYEMLHGDIT